MDYVINRRYKFDDAEIRSARALRLIVTTRERELRLEVGGDTKNRPERLLLRSAAVLPKRANIFQSVQGQIFVSAAVREELIKAGVSNRELIPIHLAADLKPLGWFRIAPTLTMPPLAISTPGLVRPTDSEQQDQDPSGHFVSLAQPLLLVYDESALKGFTAVAKTRELFGVSVTIPAEPLIIVSQDVWHALGIFGLSDVVCEPVLASNLAAPLLEYP